MCINKIVNASVKKKQEIQICYLLINMQHAIGYLAFKKVGKLIKAICFK